MSKTTICIVQARMNSTRLPSKVLMEICGKPLLLHLVERARRSKLIDMIVIATTRQREDDRIEELGKKHGIKIFRGDRDDVLKRFYECAQRLKADIIVRLTGDCPLMDAAVIDKTIRHFLKNDFDYVSNAYPTASYPDGLDVEVFSFKALETAWKEARLPSEREHITSYIWNNKEGKFRLGSVKSDIDLSAKRWTVDNPEDLKFIAAVYDNLYEKDPFFGMGEVLALLKERPELEQLNKGIARNEGYLKSLKEDKKIYGRKT